MIRLVNVAVEIGISGQAIDRWCPVGVILGGFDELSAVAGEAREGYVLARPADRIRVAEVMQMGQLHGRPAGTGPYEQPVAEAVKRVCDCMNDGLAELTLAELASCGDID